MAGPFTEQKYTSDILFGAEQAVDIPVQLSIMGTVVAPVITVEPQAVMACFICDTDPVTLPVLQ